MMASGGPSKEHVDTVLLDANVIYSRSLRDYILYAAEERLLTVAWSKEILDEAMEHLAANIGAFNEMSGIRLRQLMNEYFPVAEVVSDGRHYRCLSALKLPDEGDRHVLAAALAAEADTLCTSNTRDFPEAVVSLLGLRVVSPDALLSGIIEESPMSMLLVHRAVLEDHPGEDDASCLAALKKAGAPLAAQKLTETLAAEKRS